MRTLNQNGVSLIEVLLAAIIFSLSVAGFFAALNFTQTQTEQNNADLLNAQVGQAFLDSLRGEVDEDKLQNGTSKLKTDNCGINTTTPFSFKGTNYTVNWQLECSGVQKKVNITSVQ